MKFLRLLPFVLCYSTLQAVDPLQLDYSRVMTLAESRSLEAISAEKRTQQALARLEESRSSLYPQVTGTASQTRGTRNLNAFGIRLPGDPLVGPYNVFDARLHLSQTLFDKSALDRLRAARVGKVLSREEERKARQDVSVLALTLFVEARRAEESRVAAQAILERDVQALKIAEQRFQNGSGSSLDVAQQSADINVSRQRVAAVETERAERRFDLLAMLGLPLDTPVLFAAAPNPVEPTPLNDRDLTDALSSHVQVSVASATVVSRRADESSAKADAYPKIEAIADYGASGNLPSDSLRTYQFGGQLSLPLLEGGRRAARTESARRAREESEARLSDTRLRLEARARTAQVTLEQSWALIQATETDLAVARKQLEIADTRLRNGQGSRFEQLDRRTTAIRTEDLRAEAIATYELARIQKAYALGRLETLKDLHP